MYTLVRRAGIREGLLAEAPSMIFSFVIAELFYKFHSFTLECASFLATWFAVSFLLNMAWSAWQAPRTESSP